ncbi:MAG: OmpA family protein [Ignavibacteriaceae bacterium]
MRVLILLPFIFVFFAANSFSQIDILGKIKEKVERKVDEKTDEGIDKGIEEIEKGIEDGIEENQENPEKKNESDQEIEKKNNSKQTIEEEPLKVYSKFEFVPGDKILFYEDFTEEEVGAFPTRWNTNSTGEIVTLSKYPGKWLKLKNGASYVPDIQAPFPEDFTIEFDVIFLDPSGNGGRVGDIILHTLAISDNQKDYINHPYAYDPSESKATLLVTVPLQTNGTTSISYENYLEGQNYGINSNASFTLFENKIGKPVHFAVTQNKLRYKMWVDEKKVIDLPRFVPPAVFNTFLIGLWGWYEDDDLNQAYLSNFKFTTAMADVRKTFEKTKKFVTTGILFDVNSDIIKPESYGTLKQIADLMKDNKDKFKIVGHTDSDGDEKSNLTLSRKRSEAVVKALISEFGIDTSRLLSEGKGESEPVGDNKSPQGKASNRRVEIIKL